MHRRPRRPLRPRRPAYTGRHVDDSSTPHARDISSALGIHIRFQRYVPERGDSIAFDSTQPHRLWNAGDDPVHALWSVVGRDG